MRGQAARATSLPSQCQGALAESAQGAEAQQRVGGVRIQPPTEHLALIQPPREVGGHGVGMGQEPAVTLGFLRRLGLGRPAQRRQELTPGEFVVGTVGEVDVGEGGDAQWLLAYNVLSGIEADTHLVVVKMVRGCDVNDVDARIRDQALDTVIHPREVRHLGLGLGSLRRRPDHTYDIDTNPPQGLNMCNSDEPYSNHPSVDICEIPHLYPYCDAARLEYIHDSATIMVPYKIC